MRISDWSSDVCSSDLIGKRAHALFQRLALIAERHLRAMGMKRLRNPPRKRAINAEPHYQPAFPLHSSEERREGNECVSTVRSRWSPYPTKTNAPVHRAAHSTLYESIHQTYDTTITKQQRE